MAALSETTPGGHIPSAETSADPPALDPVEAQARGGGSESEGQASPPSRATRQETEQEELRQQLIGYYLSTGSNVPSWVGKG